MPFFSSSLKACPCSCCSCFCSCPASAALPHMMGVLHSRPALFQSLQVAVDWAVRSGMCKNREMAGVSLVSQLVQSAGAEGDVWTWRTPLAASRQYWEGWYTGLSDAFLALPVPKMLLLAGTDRYPLTLGETSWS